MQATFCFIHVQIMVIVSTVTVRNKSFFALLCLLCSIYEFIVSFFSVVFIKKKNSSANVYKPDGLGGDYIVTRMLPSLNLYIRTHAYIHTYLKPKFYFA